MDDSILRHDSGSLYGVPFKKPELIHISILYSIAVALFLFLPPVLRPFKLNFYIGGIFSELILVFLPAILLLIYCGYDIKSVLRLNKVGFMNMFITFWIMVLALPAVGVLNFLNIWLVKLAFGSTDNINIPIATDWVALLLGILVIGGSAGICEEIMFRGVIQRGFERFGAAGSIIITAILFGLLHRDMQRLFGTAALGALIGFLVYRSNSIFTGMLAHFSNNSIAVLMGYVSYKLQHLSQSQTNVTKNQGTEQMQMIIATVFLGAIVIGATAGFIALLYAFIKNTSDKVVKVSREKLPHKGKGLVWLAPGLGMIAFIFLVQGLELSGAGFGILTGVVKFLGIG
ncbi:MAG TPA: type II CAAX endopeptidase family protein [Clostridia bacterium]|nr:type II CAAX endopeptidase family protein [Clostridia bacterium]